MTYPVGDDVNAAMTFPLYSLRDSYRTNRRSFIRATASLATAALWSSQAFGAVKRQPRLSDYPFQLGVASGDPSPDGFVLWTRLAPKPLEGGGMDRELVEVSWQIADDEQFSKIVRKGTAIANPDWAHSVHVEVSGLQPDRWYWYQFKVGNETSPKGRARTLPHAHTIPSSLRFAFASCQHYEYGYYTAYEHMVSEDLDLIVHLGDYIYEGGITTDAKQPRRHNSKKIFSVDDYRNRYALYKSDKALQAAHAHAPWIVTPDDHEVENNYATDISEALYTTRKDFLQRRAHAYQAYYEHMPLSRTSLPHGPDIQLFRHINYGALANFLVLDTRQYRTDQPCGDGNKPPCPDSLSPDGTILGPRQREWLFQNLRRSRQTWNVLAQQVMMARVDHKQGAGEIFSMDQWPGYEADRRRVLKFISDAKVKNAIVLSGDIHSNWANDLLTDFDQLDSKIVASEFVGTSISSGGDGTRDPAVNKWMSSENPFVKFHNAERGYISCKVTPTEWRSDYRTVEYISKPGAPINTRASFLLSADKPGLQKI
ncbi:MAG TPA: alkaline phosphatase D family protein [Verrucomicrobiae bacterium]